jgi:hypothetical protein
MELSGLLVLLPELGANEHAVTHHIATRSSARAAKATLARDGPRWSGAHPAARVRLGARPRSATGCSARTQITKSVIEIR